MLILTTLLFCIADVKEPDLAPFAGTWTVAQADRQGMAIPAEQLKAMRVTIEGNKLTIRDGSNEDIGTIKAINADAKPATIDVQPSDSDQLLYGLYAFDGADTLKLVWSRLGTPRPKALDAKTDLGLATMTLHRKK